MSAKNSQPELFMKLHIANTDFESELSGNSLISIEKSFLLSHFVLQLHFLPWLYASPEDRILVWGEPDGRFLEAFQEKPFVQEKDINSLTGIKEIADWGTSGKIEHWASEHGLPYVHPSLDVVREVNSKEFSFNHCQGLPGAALLRTHREVEQWLSIDSPIKVIKTCFGSAGRGQIKISRHRELDREELKVFLNKEFAKGLPVIGEPWVSRELDFSTQWEIKQDREIRYLGATKMLNTFSGGYLGTLTGNEEAIFGDDRSYLEAHKNAAEALLRKAASKGYTGFAGIDAMIYLSEGRRILHPIVELNARKTMGLAALLFQQRDFPSSLLSIHYVSQEDLSPEDRPLLPECIVVEGKKKVFSKQLALRVF